MLHVPYAVNVDTCVTDNEHIVAQACECPFVRNCVMVAAVETDLCVPRPSLWQGLFV